MRQLLTAHGVAEALALRSARCFHARRRRLEAEHGFPAPVPGIGLRWDPAAIEAWLGRQRGPAPIDSADGVEALLMARARAIGEAGNSLRGSAARLALEVVEGH